MDSLQGLTLHCADAVASAGAESSVLDSSKRAGQLKADMYAQQIMDIASASPKAVVKKFNGELVTMKQAVALAADSASCEPTLAAELNTKRDSLP